MLQILNALDCWERVAVFSFMLEKWLYQRLLTEEDKISPERCPHSVVNFYQARLLTTAAVGMGSAKCSVRSLRAMGGEGRGKVSPAAEKVTQLFQDQKGSASGMECHGKSLSAPYVGWGSTWK